MSGDANRIRDHNQPDIGVDAHVQTHIPAPALKFNDGWGGV
jgi:hypothetical protein